jgi:hypothetical protein
LKTTSVLACSQNEKNNDLYFLEEEEMKKVRLLCILLPALLLALAVAAQAGPIGLVDDLSGNLLPYTLSRVNDGGTVAHVSFSNTTGDLRAAYTGTPNAYEQVLFLRDDYTLDIGERLSASVNSTLVGWDRDIGIAVGWTETPPSLAPGSSGDVRTSYVEVSFRSNNQVVSYARKDAANLTSGQEFSGTIYGGVSFTAPPDYLFIDRITATKFNVGWIDGGITHVLTNNGAAFALPYEFTGATNVPGAAVGFYGDVRVAIASSPTGLDNLQIGIAPEPATIALLGLGGLLLRRKRA